MQASPELIIVHSHFSDHLPARRHRFPALLVLPQAISKELESEIPTPCFVATSADASGSDYLYMIGASERSQRSEDSPEEEAADVFLSITRPSSRSNTRHERVVSNESSFSEVCVRISQRFQDALYGSNPPGTFVARPSTRPHPREEQSPQLASGFQTPVTSWRTDEETMDFDVYGDDDPVECILPMEEPEDVVMDIILDN